MWIAGQDQLAGEGVTEASILEHAPPPHPAHAREYSAGWQCVMRVWVCTFTWCGVECISLVFLCPQPPPYVYMREWHWGPSTSPTLQAYCIHREKVLVLVRLLLLHAPYSCPQPVCQKQAVAILLHLEHSSPCILASMIAVQFFLIHKSCSSSLQPLTWDQFV